MQKLGKYEIITLLGSGATAEVYHARDTILGREVALKVLKPALVPDQQAFARFIQEAQAAAGLFHPNIATVLDMGDADGRYFIAMRYIPGQSLDRILKDAGPLPWAETLRMAQQVGAALDYARQKGFLHRDVKPSNIVRTTEGEYVLTDFGLTRAMMSTGLTSHTGAVLGTPAYIAPEIWNGEPANPATDQYALACVIYEAMTGKVLFTGETPPAIMTKHVLKGAELPEAWPEGVPEDVQSPLERALANDSEKRFPDCSALTSALASLRTPERIRREAEESAKREADERARLEVEHRAQAEALERTRQEAEGKARRETEEKARREAEERVRLEAEAKRQLEAQTGAALHLTPKKAKFPVWGYVVGGIALVAILVSVSIIGCIGGAAITSDAANRAATQTALAIAAWPTVAPGPNTTPLPPTATKIPTSTQMSGVVTFVRSIMAHSNRVTSVAFSPNGQIIASGADDNTVRLWQVADGTRLRTLYGHTDFVYGVAFSPDGETLASGSEDKTVRLWRVSDGTLLRTLTESTSGLFSVAFSPDGQVLVAGSGDNSIYVWQANNGELISTLRGHSDAVHIIAFSLDGSKMASGSGDGTVRVWQTRDWNLLRTYDRHTSIVWGIAFSPDGQILASGSSDGTVRLWSLANGATLHILNAPGGAGRTIINSQGTIVATCGGEWNYPKIWLWQIANGVLLSKSEALNGEVCRYIAFNPSGNLIAAAFHDGTVRIWQVEP